MPLRRVNFKPKTTFKSGTGSFIADIPVEVLGFLLVCMQQQATPFLCQRI